MLHAAAAFTTAFLVSLLMTPAVGAFARSRGLVAPLAADRWHRRPTALLGGVAIFAGLLAGVLGTALWGGLNGAGISNLPPQAVGIVIAAAMMFATGLIDDRIHLRPSTKLIAQTAAAAVVVGFGVVYPITSFAPLNVLFTVFWLIALTNALNLLDNMDGVAAGVGGICGLFLGIAFLLSGSPELAVVCLALAGAAFGFLPYNFHPASIFMGDSGSLVLGSLIAALGAAYPGTVQVGILPVLFVPVFVAIIPILDTLLVSTTRTLAGVPLSQGGRDHTSHRLVRLGLSERQVALLLYAFAVAGGLFAFALDRTSLQMSGALGILFLVMLGLLAVYLSGMHKYEGNGEQANSMATVVVSDLLHKRRGLEVLMDLVLFGVAYNIAHLLRWDGVLPVTQRELLENTLVLAVVGKSVAFGLMGVYKGGWQHIGLTDAHRIVTATMLGSLITFALIAGIYRDADFSRSVLLIDALLVLLFTGAARLSFRSMDSVRHALTPAGIPTVIYGAGRGGEFLVREVQANTSLPLTPVAFLDDDRQKQGLRVHGLPVLGGRNALERAVEERGIRAVVVATRKIDPAALAETVRICRTLGIDILVFEISLKPYSVAAPNISPVLRLENGSRRTAE